MDEKIGIIGLGAMGAVMAGHLLGRGFKVCGYDVNPGRVKAVSEPGLEAKTSPKEVAADAGILITSLPSATALRNVIGGEDGILDQDSPGQILIETSTLSVGDKIAAGEMLEEAGKIFLDAPVSGTTDMLRNMAASIYVGGDKAAFEKSLPALESFTAHQFHVGGIGDSSKMKILANYLVYVHSVAAAECMTLAQKAGLDLETVHKVLQNGAGTSRMFEVRGELMVNSDYRYAEGSMFGVFAKDAKIISNFAASVESPISLFAVARQTFVSAMAQGLGHLELAAVCKAVETAAGIDRKLAE
ncbi:MAG: NAD(P)-dependent oxidoreductase [Rhodospirillales bacterium]|nr:NAD(P)-dependent oxidoreductase [Rhodospirillales bacterium]